MTHLFLTLVTLSPTKSASAPLRLDALREHTKRSHPPGGFQALSSSIFFSCRSCSHRLCASASRSLCFSSLLCHKHNINWPITATSFNCHVGHENVNIHKLKYQYWTVSGQLQALAVLPHGEWPQHPIDKCQDAMKTPAREQRYSSTTQK